MDMYVSLLPMMNKRQWWIAFKENFFVLIQLKDNTVSKVIA